MKKLRTPIHDRLDQLIKLQVQILNDMVKLLQTMPEEEAKPYILELNEQGKAYKRMFNELLEKSKKQFGDFEYVNPKYKDSFNPERY